MDAFDAPLATVDLLIIAAYFAAVVALGLRASGRTQGAQDYFLASRSMRWPAIGAALLSANVSSTTLIGLAGGAYAFGIAIYNYEWMATVVLAFFCVFFLPFLLRARVYTLPEFLERRYDRRARLYFSGLTLFLNVAVDTAGTLYGGALMLSLVVPDVPLTAIVAALAAMAGLYTVLGGLRAVILTEVLQAVVLMGAAVLVAVYAFDAAGGWSTVMAAAPPEKLSLIRPADDPDLPWTGLVFGVPLLGFYFWCTNQYMVQRVLSAKDENHGRWGALFAGLLKLPLLYLMVLPGTCALLLYPSLSKPDLVYPTLVFDLLPAGVVGLVLAGFFAAIMSSISSTFNSAATLVTMDVVRTARPGLDEATLVRIGRSVTVAVMVLAVLWAPQIARFDSLWQYLQGVLAYAVPPVCALYLVGLFWRRANTRGAMCCMATGLIGGAALFVANVAVEPGLGLHFLLVAPLLFVACALAHAIGSCTAPRDPRPELDALHWTPAFFRAETVALRRLPWWQNYRVHAVALLALTAAIVWTFR